MARNHGWTIVLSLLLGILGTSIFWLYGPYLKSQIARQVAEAVKERPLPPGGSEGGLAALRAAPASVSGSRYQLVADGKQVFLADLQLGRVWRYFHHTREAGSSKEDEGFLPLAFFYGGKKYYTASEVEPPPAKAAPQVQTKPGEKKPR